MSFYYSQDKNILNIVALLKAHGIKKIVASPGITNACLVASLQYDDNFEIYSCVDERSAAYMAVGIAAESKEPVVITCTEATASRNYYPGLTEAYHRKLPILAITGMHKYYSIGNLEPQVIDRSVSPIDTFKLKVHLPVINNEEDIEYSAYLINQAILELTHHGCGPVHINMPWPGGNFDFSAKSLPDVRVIKRYTYEDRLPQLPQGKIAIYCGMHLKWCAELEHLVEQFCAENDAVVFCSHINGYHGKYAALAPKLAISKFRTEIFSNIDLLIHIGEEPEDYATRNLLAENVKMVWRVSPDGELRNLFGKLSNVYEMSETHFFEKYVTGTAEIRDSYLRMCKECLEIMKKEQLKIPFSNLYAASCIAPHLPQNSILHLGASTTLRAWTMFEVPESVSVSGNLGCRGIDGSISSLVGASFIHGERLYFGVVGDLTFFYDMNALGNRHIGSNVRILLVNNGGGTLFRNTDYCHSQLGLEATNEYIAAAGHFGNMSEKLVKNYAENLGFEYLCAHNEDEFDSMCKVFLQPEITFKPILFEIFTTDEDEGVAFKTLYSQSEDTMKKMVKSILGEKGTNTVKKILGK